MNEPEAYVFAPYRLLPQRRLLLSGGEPVKLGGRAFEVLLALVERRDRTVGKHELIDLVWPRLVVEENNLQVQMVALRKLLGHAAIATVPGRGYRFTLPVRVEGEAAPLADEPAAPRGAAPGAGFALIGREHDLRAVRALLQQHALVTIAGAGGIGKTRLAQAVAAGPGDAWPDGVHWVDLSVSGDNDRVAETVAQALGLTQAGGGDAVAALWATLPGQAALLVLDNAEHLAAGVAGFVARLGPLAPRLRVLVTSQEVLRVAGEQVYRPEPLALPDSDDPATIAASAAVALFVARAQAVSRHFALDEGNRGAIADICRRLDGIPLAIELAAARAPLLGVQGLRERLDQRLHVLTGGQRTSLRRHQTLRAALDWSVHLLSAPEQAVLRRIAVFVGGFTLEAAQQVAEDDEGLDGWDVLEHLGALVDKSLVMVEGEARPRYRLLETTRLFALERLIDSGEAAAVRSRHLDHFLAQAELAREQMLVADPRGLRLLDLERDNLLLALAWRPAGEDAMRSLRLVAAMRFYWTSRGLLPRALETAQAALEHARGQPPSEAQCRVLGELGFLHRLTGDLAAAGAAAAAAVSMARGLGDPALLSMMLASAGFVHLRLGELAQARACADEALALTDTLGDGSERGNALGLCSAVHLESGERDEAMRWQREVLAMRQRMGHVWSQAVAHLNLAGMALDGGLPQDARRHLCEVLALLPRVDSEYIGVNLLDEAAVWAAVAGRHDEALVIEAARRQHQRRVGIDGGADPRRDRLLAPALAAAGPARQAALAQRGAALSYADALAAVRAVLAADGAAA